MPITEFDVTACPTNRLGQDLVMSDYLATAASRQDAAARTVVAAVLRDAPAPASAQRTDLPDRSDPQAWLFTERARYLADGHCDPYAEMTLRRAGLLTGN